MDWPIIRHRMHTVGRVVLWTGMAILLSREISGIVKDVRDHPVPKVEARAEVSVPDAAKTVGEKFLWHWYTYVPQEAATDRVNRLSPFVSPALADEMQTNPDISPVATNPSNPKAELVANRVDQGDARWVEPGKSALIHYWVQLKDRRTLYVEVPVRLMGKWVVTGLPSLVPEPTLQKESEPNPPEISDTQTNEIQAMLDSFFPDWLAGKKEAVKRYCLTSIPTSDLLGAYQGTYQSVKITPLSSSPVKVRATVSIQDKNSVIMRFQYDVTLQEKNNQWYIQDIER